MRRWNGWGDENICFPLPENAHRYLVERIGEATPLPDATLDNVLEQVPESRLPDHPLVTKTPEDRMRHARGQSLPDWLALRSGNLGVFPDGIAYPTSSEDTRSLFTYAKETESTVIPYGGGTSVVGHINPGTGKRPVLTIDMCKMNRLLNIDKESNIATFHAGTAGPDVESQLRAHGYTLGHFPQSFEFSTLGGWIATRSSGQESLRYGRIEQLFAGGIMETPVGTLDIPSFPASATGPDLCEIVLGSEGRFGILTEVKVRVRPLPKRERFHVMLFPHWKPAMNAVRTAAQDKTPLSMLRLSNVEETETQLTFAGHERLVAVLEKLVAWRGLRKDKCMLIFGVTGNRKQCRVTLNNALLMFKKEGGLHIGSYIGRKWAESRFSTPYLRNTLWEMGYAVDTLETATDWQNINHLVNTIESAMHDALAHNGERIHVFSHLSHVYPQGSSIYTTYLFRTGKTYEETFERWQCLKTAASSAIISNGGTISHHHGIGVDHAPFLAKEKGELGMATIKSLCRQFDPVGMMNPGKLVG